MTTRSSTSPALTARTASWRTTPPGSAASSSATSSWSPATPPGRRSTSWPTTGPGPHCCSYPGWSASTSPAPLPASTSPPAPPSKGFRWVHFIAFLVLFILLTSGLTAPGRPASAVNHPDFHPRRASTAGTSGTNNGCGSAGQHWTRAFPVRQATHCYQRQSADGGQHEEHRGQQQH